MKTFLIVVSGVVVGLAIVVALGILWLKRKLKGLGRALAAVCGGGSVPPFRVSLEPCSNPEWSNAEMVDAVTRRFEAQGYQTIADYEVPEMDGVIGRGFCHREACCYAFVYQPPGAGLIADVALEFTDGTHLTVTSAPESGLDRPPHAPNIHLPIDLASESGPAELHQCAVSESQGREAVPVRSSEFAEIFVEAYTQEMDWRIARGGVTEEEVRRTSEVAGMEPPDECAIGMVQNIWSGAIDGFIQEEVRNTWLADSGMSAVEWEARRDRLVVIHDRSDREERIDELAWRLVAGSYAEEDDAAEDRALGAAKEQLAPLMQTGSLRRGFRQAQDLLPEKHRYEHLASLDLPWPADLYLIPESADF